ncbi:MAG: phosphate transport system permease protein, partial [Limisphaerales bacterium]
PSDLGRSGGIGPMLASTFLIVLLATGLAALVSMPAAVLYTELDSPRWYRRAVSATMDIGIGVPRIVWGLFGGVVFGGVLGLGFSVASGVLTLACLLSPILVTGFISGLQAVDPALREQCAALGVSRWRAFWRQILPAARPALIAATALGVGRGCGDAAALLFTAGVVSELPQSLLDPAATLAVFVFHLLTTIPGGQTAAYTAAGVLFLITLAIQVGIAGADQQEGLAR